MTDEEIAAWRILCGARQCDRGQRFNEKPTCPHIARNWTVGFSRFCVCCVAEYGGLPNVESVYNCDGSLVNPDD